MASLHLCFWDALTARVDGYTGGKLLDSEDTVKYIYYYFVINLVDVWVVSANASIVIFFF